MPRTLQTTFVEPATLINESTGQSYRNTDPTQLAAMTFEASKASELTLAPSRINSIERLLDSLSPDTDARVVAEALEWCDRECRDREEVLRAIELGPATSLDVRAAVMDKCKTQEERMAILHRVMLPGNSADLLLA
jgi:hypothetical protein